MTASATPMLDPYRLPRVAIPTRYDVELVPDLQLGTFDGWVEVRVDVQEPTADLVLNAVDLDVVECRVAGADATWRLEPATERLVVTPAAPLEPGPVVLTIEFAGVLNDKLRGFYRSTYSAPGPDGEIERVIATTQMQATDCRRAFPCWDEPDLKAVFGITLVVDPDLLAVSNEAEVGRDERPGGKVAVRFADTMPMSTYLVAFVVGPLEATEPVDVDGTPLRIVHVPGKGDLTGFALEVGAFALRWFEQYYGIPYPSTKVDLLALPDFAAGAMENLGCITFRESLLLLDPATSTQSEHQNVADVVAHELAHMWFGDLVTMRWWNGIWLNEAFATFMEIAACAAFRPDWERWTLFGLERSAAFETDSLASTRPVEYEVQSPADCEGMFDVLTYQKGGALLRMLEQYLGEERFREGVSHYLSLHQYANTETNDLWDALEEKSGEPVRRMMDSWIWQPGYPLVSASLEGDDLVLRQQRFAFDGDALGADAATTWLVPVRVRVGDEITSVLLDDGTATARVPLATPGDPVVVNAGGHGFYRVAYDGELRRRISDEVLGSLDTLERYNLVDDAWNEVVAGRLAAADYLTFVEGFGGERELAVWQAIVLGVRGLARLVDDDHYPALQARVRGCSLPSSPSSAIRSPARTTCGRSCAACSPPRWRSTAATRPPRRVCAELYERAQADAGEVEPELTAAAITVVAATGDEAVYERLLSRYRSAATPQDQLRHLYALAEFDSEALVLRTCELALSDEVKTQNGPFLLRTCIANRRHGVAAWQFVRRHWDEANRTFPNNTIVRMIDAVRLLTDEAVAADVQAFFAEHPIDQAAKTLDQILERQRVNVALRAREANRFAAAL